MLHRELTDSIIGGFYKVYNTLGHGFLEKIYENALLIELGSMQLAVSQQHPIKVLYEGATVGEYFADLLVENLVVLELKAADQLRQEHVAQLTNYLKATEKEVGLLLNFGRNPEFKRIVFSNSKKDPR
jgi:GxxExxY protein